MTLKILIKYIQNGSIKVNVMPNAIRIIKKVFPNAFADGIEGVGLHPIRVAIK